MTKAQSLALSTSSVCTSLPFFFNSVHKQALQIDSMVEITTPGRPLGLSESTESFADCPHVLLYSRSKVYIHPTAYSRDNIPGWLALVKRVCDQIRTIY